MALNIEIETYDKKITSIGRVEIDEIFFEVEKTEESGDFVYQILIYPPFDGAAMSITRSDGSFIHSDEQAIDFLKRLEEMKNSYLNSI